MVTVEMWINRDWHKWIRFQLQHWTVAIIIVMILLLIVLLLLITLWYKPTACQHHWRAVLLQMWLSYCWSFPGPGETHSRAAHKEMVSSDAMLHSSRGGSRICLRGPDLGEHGARAYKGSLGSEPPAGSRGRAPAGGQWGEDPFKLKAFCPFSYKRGDKR